MYNQFHDKETPNNPWYPDPGRFPDAAGMEPVAGGLRDARPAGGTGTDAVADALLVRPRTLACELNPIMIQRRNIFLLLAGLALILASLACGLGSPPEAAAPEMTPPAESSEPEEEPTDEEPVPLIPLPTPTAASGEVEPQPAIPESRRLTLEFPPVVRAGDSTRIRLQLEVDDRGNLTPTAVVEGNVVTGEVVEIPNLYETHNVIAEARLDMAGMEVQPQGPVSEPLLPGQEVVFYWSIRPNDAGQYEGTAWLHLRFVPKAGGEESRIPVSVQFLEIESKSFLGFLSGGAARGIGAVGSVVGGVLGFPFVDDLMKWIWRKIRNK